MLTDIELKPLSDSTWDDFENLFGEKGACGQCWCMSFGLQKSDFEEGKKSGLNKERMSDLAKSNQATGLVAYLNKVPFAWMAFAPREDFKRLEKSRIHKPIDNEKVWSMPCFFMAKKYRRQGYSVHLLEKLKEYSARQHINIIEAYPTISSTNLPDPFVWVGLYKSFERAGFKIVDQTSKNRPMVRWVND